MHSYSFLFNHLTFVTKDVMMPISFAAFLRTVTQGEKMTDNMWGKYVNI